MRNIFLVFMVRLLLMKKWDVRFCCFLRVGGLGIVGEESIWDVNLYEETMNNYNITIISQLLRIY